MKLTNKATAYSFVRKKMGHLRKISLTYPSVVGVTNANTAADNVDFIPRSPYSCSICSHIDPHVANGGAVVVVCYNYRTHALLGTCGSPVYKLKIISSHILITLPRSKHHIAELLVGLIHPL